MCINKESLRDIKYPPVPKLSLIRVEGTQCQTRSTKCCAFTNHFFWLLLVARGVSYQLVMLKIDIVAKMSVYIICLGTLWSLPSHTMYFIRKIEIENVIQ